MAMNKPCPCGSGRDYADCCGPLHQGQAVARTAEALMRSRYSAFVFGNTDYLQATWHAATRPAELSLDDAPHWLRLEIVSTAEGGEQDETGRVEFVAHFMDQGRAGQLHENSRFAKQDGRWFYVDGELCEEPVQKVSRNAPCPCGSGKKFKRCCGA